LVIGDGEFYVGRRVEVLFGGLVVGGLGGHDVGDPGLGVAVVEGEPGALDLDHDAGPLRKTWSAAWREKPVFLGGVGGDGFGVGAVADRTKKTWQIRRWNAPEEVFKSLGALIKYLE
jgi:hypothetical protein